MIDINLDPVLVRLGPVMITWHGFFTAVAVLAGIWLATRFAVERGFTEDDIMSIALWSVVAAATGRGGRHEAKSDHDGEKPHPGSVHRSTQTGYPAHASACAKSSSKSSGASSPIATRTRSSVMPSSARSSTD